MQLLSLQRRIDRRVCILVFRHLFVLLVGAMLRVPGNIPQHCLPLAAATSALYLSEILGSFIRDHPSTATRCCRSTCSRAPTRVATAIMSKDHREVGGEQGTQQSHPSYTHARALPPGPPPRRALMRKHDTEARVCGEGGIYSRCPSRLSHSLHAALVAYSMPRCVLRVKLQSWFACESYWSNFNEH